MDLLKEAEKNNPKSNWQNLKVKLVSFFANIRIFNVLLLVLAQYLAAIFIFSKNQDWLDVIQDIDLALVVVCTICVVAGGYIINNFYDFESDRINRPYKTSLENRIAQKTKLKLYFLLNFMGFGFSFLISWRAAVFFASYIFLIWFYSHKLKNYPVIGFITAAILQLLPFFVVFVYYRNFSTVIFAHASFLFFLLLMKEIVKGIEHKDGYALQDKNSLVLLYGLRFSKLLYFLLTLLILNPVYYMLKFENIGKMSMYFYLAYAILLLSNVLLYFGKSQKSYLLVHNLLRVLLFLGVFSIALIPS